MTWRHRLLWGSSSFSVIGPASRSPLDPPPEVIVAALELDSLCTQGGASDTLLLVVPPFRGFFSSSFRI